MAEDPKGRLLGPTLTCLISDQFLRLKLGDRFWYETNDDTVGFTIGKSAEIFSNTFNLIHRHLQIPTITTSINLTQDNETTEKDNKPWLYSYQTNSTGQLSFTEQLTEIRKTSLAGIICANEALLDQAQPRVMEAVTATNPLVDCMELPQPDFAPWADPTAAAPITTKPHPTKPNKSYPTKPGTPYPTKPSMTDADDKSDSKPGKKPKMTKKT